MCQSLETIELLAVGVAGPPSLYELERETHDSSFAHPSGRSVFSLLSRLTEKLKGLMLRKEYSRVAGERQSKWGPLTPAVRQQNAYKVSTLELSVNVKTFAWGIWLCMQLQRPCLGPSNQTMMAINCSATYGCSWRDVSFNTPTCTESFEGAIFKGAKTYSEGVLISVGRQTVWDHWEHGHERAIIFHQSLLQLACLNRLQEGKLAQSYWGTPHPLVVMMFCYCQLCSNWDIDNGGMKLSTHTHITVRKTDFFCHL